MIEAMGSSIGFLGGGNMASAMIGGLLGCGWQSADLMATDVDPAARGRLSDTYSVRTSPDAAETVRASRCVVLAVKPQQLRDLCAGIAGSLEDRLVVSIAAGIRTPDLSRWLGGHRRIVRVMPNTPALLRAGISAAYALPEVPPSDRQSADALLQAIGKVMWVEDETLMDGVTAVSGSGPAYAFYLIEAMQEAARRLGFTDEQGRLLSVETVLGAAKLAEASQDPAAVLRARVTSKAGTTERALSVMEAHDTKAHLVEAILAAAERSRELGDALGRD
ncbi:MAG: pyrroline-5-carboxylate reductase [Betaproteobacteria bacterium]|nr:pyrroline-5-carboxylate reductase [Betaproteobacteria bacterium]